MTHIELHDKNNNTVLFPVHGSVFIRCHDGSVDCICSSYNFTPIESFDDVFKFLETASTKKPRIKKIKEQQ